MKKPVLAFVCAVVLLLLVSPGHSTATYIDFRLSPFGISANNSLTYSQAIGSLTLTFTPIGSNKAKLYWDSDDGFGVQNGGGYEADEIEDPEQLLIAFSTKTYVSYFDLTDFFYETRSDKSYFEIGYWSLDGTKWIEFEQTAQTTINGEYRLSINQQLEQIYFTAPGKTISGQDHEFSVAGVAVPEPKTMLLFGLGLLGLAGVGRRIKKA